MTIDKRNLNNAATGIQLSSGQMVAELRELRGLSQNELAELTGISQANISAIENDRVEVGKKRAILLAEALKVHPASIMFSDYEQVA